MAGKEDDRFALGVVEDWQAPQSSDRLARPELDNNFAPVFAASDTASIGMLGRHRVDHLACASGTLILIWFERDETGIGYCSSADIIRPLSGLPVRGG